MSLGNGTHWRGPLVGSDKAGDGLLEDVPVQYIPWVVGEAGPKFFATEFISAGATFAREWTQTDVGVVAAVTIPQNGNPPGMILTHGVANEGPSVRYLGTEGQGDGMVNLTAGSSSLFMCRLRHSVGVASNDLFVGLMTQVAAHPLLATGLLNVAGVADGVGFHFLDANNGVPTMVAWGTNTAETLVGPPVLAAWGGNVIHTVGARLQHRAGNLADVTWYLDGRRMFGHRMVNAFVGRMTFGLGLIANAAGASVLATHVLVGGRLATPNPAP